MPKKLNAKKEDTLNSSKNIEIPAISKQTAGAVAGAAVGSIAGPIGAVVGGVVGAIVGKAAEKRRPIAPATNAERPESHEKLKGTAQTKKPKSTKS